MGLSDRFKRWFTRIHPRVYLATGGWLGHRLGWFPTLVLQTKGRRSGLAGNAALPYRRDGDSYLVIASNFGGGHPPAWLLNLQAEPRVRILLRRRWFDARAEAVFPGDPSYEGLWKIASSSQRVYDRYREGTSRPIPVVRLAPL
jgi:deazaflavin-dependent oxidoreductase (nitroreductase family)